MQYKQMNFEQRYTMERLLKKGQSKAFIASVLGRSESSVSREMKRNSRPRGSYNAKYAQMLADERKKGGHLEKHFSPKMERYVRDKLENHQWSPEQIVGRAKLEGMEMVSHERIYQFVWKDKAAGGLLYKNLRNSSKKYKKRYGGRDNRGRIPDKVSIEERPPVVGEKTRIGDFESDLIIGKNHQGALWTSVDRYSSFVLIEDVGGKKPAMVAKKKHKRPCALQRMGAHHHQRQRQRVQGTQANRQKIGLQGIFCTSIFFLGKGAQRVHQQTHQAIFSKRKKPERR
ncbi:MAG TPA: IS30 family transposase [Flavobacteriaceae bacterium]|nr:IS30 family transposase [Flavobacteriaceae bacterium]